MSTRARLPSTELIVQRGRRLRSVSATRPGVAWWSGPALDLFAFADGNAEVWFFGRAVLFRKGALSTGHAFEGRSVYAGAYEDLEMDDAPDRETLEAALLILGTLAPASSVLLALMSAIEKSLGAVTP